MNRIIYANVDGAVSVVTPAPDAELTIEEIALKDVPDGLSYEIVDVADIPSDRTLRDSWFHDMSAAPQKIGVDMIKAKNHTHSLRRKSREKELNPLDKEINIKVSNSVKVGQLESQRQALRDKYSVMQTDIDSCSDAGQLNIIINTMVK